MSTHMPGFQSFSSFLHHLVKAILAASSIRVKEFCPLFSTHSIHYSLVKRAHSHLYACHGGGQSSKFKGHSSGSSTC